MTTGAKPTRFALLGNEESAMGWAIRIAALLAGLFLTGMAAANSFQDGLIAYKRGDFATAYRIWLPLADDGLVGAQYSIGALYQHGQGVPRDSVAAANWYARAAAQGFDRAQYDLAVKYYTGDGVVQDHGEAFKWYARAAAQGNPRAQNNLGYMYAKGEGTQPDPVQAHRWLSIAASRYAASDDRDRTIRNRDIVARSMTPEQIAEAKRLAREWRPKPEW